MPLKKPETLRYRNNKVIICSQHINKMKATNTFYGNEPKWDQLEVYNREQKDRRVSKKQRGGNANGVFGLISADKKFKIL